LNKPLGAVVQDWFGLTSLILSERIKRLNLFRARTERVILLKILYFFEGEFFAALWTVCG